MENEEKIGEGTSANETGAQKPAREAKRGTRRRRTLIFIAVSLLNAGLLALLASQVLVPAQNQGQTGTGNSPLIGHQAPDFTLAALSPHPAPAVHLASFKGRLIMLNFWASWCVPCKHEAPLLQAGWQRVQNQGVVFIGIDFEDTQSDGLYFMRSLRRS